MILFSGRSIKTFGSGVKSRVGRVTGNTTLFFFGLMEITKSLQHHTDISNPITAFGRTVL